jgi:hypothetical protein
LNIARNGKTSFETDQYKTANDTIEVAVVIGEKIGLPIMLFSFRVGSSC